MPNFDPEHEPGKKKKDVATQKGGNEAAVQVREKEAARWGENHPNPR